MDLIRHKKDCCRKKEYRKKHEHHKPPSLFLLGGFISHRAVCLSKQLSIQPSDQAPDPPDRMRQPVRISKQQIHEKSRQHGSNMINHDLISFLIYCKCSLFESSHPILVRLVILHLPGIHSSTVSYPSPFFT